MAKEFTQVNFAVSGKQEFGHEMDSLGLDVSEDVVVGLYDAKGKYAMTEKFRWVWPVGVVEVKLRFCCCSLEQC